MPNIVIGEPTYTEQPFERSYRVGKGWETRRSFRGSYDSLVLLEEVYVAGGWNTNLTGGPVWELTCTTPGDGDTDPPGGGNTEIVSTWEMAATAGEIDIVKSGLVDSLGAADKALLRDIARGNKSYEGIASGDFVDSNGYDLFLLMRDGASSRQIFYPTLRHTQTGSNVYSFDPALYAVGEIVSTANLIANQPSIPTSIRNQMFATSAVVRNGLTFYYAWMTSFPQISVTLDNHSQLIQEWQWGLWSNLLYAYNA